MNTLKISIEDAQTIIREKFGLPENYRIDIYTDQNIKECVDSGWIDVPADWNKPFAPVNVIANRFDMIEVMYRNQRTQILEPTAYPNLWIQAGYAYDIVKYRKDS